MNLTQRIARRECAALFNTDTLAAEWRFPPAIVTRASLEQTTPHSPRQALRIGYRRLDQTDAFRNEPQYRGLPDVSVDAAVQCAAHEHDEAVSRGIRPEPA